MKRRTFNLLSTSSIAAVAAGLGLAKPAMAAGDPSRLKSELTPFGGERAGNASGTIPAWTGENLPLPAGGGPWGIMPDFFAGDAKIVSINATNMDQYKDKLTPGSIAMMQKYADYRVDVYPTHRTFVAPQEVYDNAAINVTSVVPSPEGSRMGFLHGYGAVPFPIPNPTDMAEAGAQIMTNHQCRFMGYYQTRYQSIYTVIDGELVLAIAGLASLDWPYYHPGRTWQQYEAASDKYELYEQRETYYAPANSKGQTYMEISSTNQLNNPVKVWEYLVGQGRTRKAPELQYDTPETQTNDATNYDESYCFFGSMDQYDWKCLGKKEMYIPYNNNKIYNSNPTTAHLTNYLNPDLVRWELHRVWVVDATLRQGYRNVLPHRVFYMDEDTWVIGATESYDAQGNLVRVSQNYVENRPDIPGAIYGGTTFYDMQAPKWVSLQFFWDVHPFNEPVNLQPIQDSFYNPNSMAASSQY